jgi:hypothetical protein
MGKVIKSGYVGQPHAHLTGPTGLRGNLAQAPANAGAAVHPPQINGYPLWSELHRRALTHQGEDSVWLAAFARRLPCGDCLNHWFLMSRRTPPDWTKYFSWTVARHNEVNARIGKKPISDAEALAIWG